MNRRQNPFALIIIIIGLILFIDQLYLFGIPFGGFLGDLSSLDITGNPDLRHWMIGMVLIVLGIWLNSYNNWRCKR